jgi:hypothetical protein
MSLYRLSYFLKNFEEEVDNEIIVVTVLGTYLICDI